MRTTSVETFLDSYHEPVAGNALLLRKMVLRLLPGIREELDLPAKMITYSYGPRYADLICVIIPSKKGLKLGFNNGPELPDPDGLLQGTAKTTRYMIIPGKAQIRSQAIAKLLAAALNRYKNEMSSP